ncbi:TPA: zinc ABC transporter substrate-binding protein [Neisseria weaveri]
MKNWQAVLIAAVVPVGAYAAPMPVVTGFSILGDITKQIGGERVDVQNLVGHDQDSHVYQMTAGDVRKIRNAKLVVLNGLGLEAADIRRAAKQGKAVYAEAAAGIKALEAGEHHHHHHDHGHDHGHHHHDHGEFDPHVWTDPVLMKTYAANIAQALIKADPEGKAYYSKRLTDYQAQLTKLHEETKKTFDSIPAEKRKVLTGHDSFAYMAKRYNIQFTAAQGVSTAAEPSAKQIAAIIRQIKRSGIKAVFAENIKDTRQIERIAKETGVKLNGKLYSDALGSRPEADTYIEMYRYNVKALADAMKQ